MVIRFLDGNKQIREPFLGFITVERITGEAVSAAPLSWLEEHEIDITLCRGQGCASSMSSSRVDVQARIYQVCLA